MLEIITEKNKALYFEHLNINEKKFFNKRVLLAILFFLAYFFLFVYNSNNLWLLLGIPFVMLLGFKIPYMELVSKKSRQDMIKQYIFPNFLMYFSGLLNSQGNVYQTLKATVDYIHEPRFKQELEKLIQKLDEKNTNNRDAFMDFAEFIGTSEAQLTMSIIYGFYEEGINKKELDELENIIQQLMENKTNELIEYKVAKMDKHANPILLYALIYIVIFTLLLQASYLKELLLNI